MLRISFLSFTLLLGLVSAAFAADAEDEIWEGMRSGAYIALMRHALAPGTGDPPRFTLEDCSTQRNLSEEGRVQAAQTGALFERNGIAKAEVYSSRWCRCLETARLLNLGPVQQLPALDSFFQDRRKEEPQTRALLDWLSSRNLSRPIVLVTHQVNITALTGIFPQSGEIVVIRVDKDNRIEVVGRLIARDKPANHHQTSSKSGEALDI